MVRFCILRDLRHAHTARDIPPEIRSLDSFQSMTVEKSGKRTGGYPTQGVAARVLLSSIFNPSNVRCDHTIIKKIYKHRIDKQNNCY